MTLLKKISILFFAFIAVNALFSDTFEEVVGKIKDKSLLEQIIYLDKYVEEGADVRFFILKAKNEIKSRDFIGAAKTTLSAQDRFGDSSEILNLMGLSYFYLNDFEKSYRCFNKSLAINNEDNFAKSYLSIIDPYTKPSYRNIENAESVDIAGLSEEFTAKYDIEDMKDNYVYLLNEKDVEIIDSGKFNYTVHCVVKILTNDGVGMFRDFSYSYNSYEYKADVLRAGSYSTELEFKSINPKNIVNIDKNSSSENSFYSNKKYVAFPFPDLQSGSLLEFKIKFSSTGKTLSPKSFDQYLFSSSVPVSTSRYKITYPDGLKPNIRVIGDEVQKSESKDGAKATEIYEYFSPPVFNLAYESVSIYDVSPQILVGFYDSWDEVSLWYNGIFEKAVNAKDGDLNDVILKELAIYESDKLKTVEKIYKYVQKNIRYVALELGEGAMVPHTPKEIYKNKFGDCKDQAVFMAYLLGLYGIDAKPVLVSTIDNGRINEEIPSPYYFNHVIVYIPVQSGVSSEIFCDTTSSVTPFLNLPSVDQGVRVLVIGENGDSFFATTPVIAPEQNRIEEIYKATLNLSGSGEMFYSEIFSGSYSEILRYSFINRSEKEIEAYLLDIQKKNFPQLQPENFILKGANEQSGPIEASYSAFEKNLASVFYDGRLKIKYTVGNLAGFLNLPEKSNYDHRREFLSSYYKSIEYIIPENYEIVEGEVRNFSRENEFVYLDFKVDKKDVNTLIFEFELKFKKRTIPKEELAEVHKTLNEFTSATAFELTLANTRNFDHVSFYESLSKDYELKEVYENYIKKMIELRNYEKAIEVSDRAISKFRDYINFYLIKSSIQFDGGDIDGSETTLLTALSVDPKNVEIYYYLIDLYKKSSNDLKLEKTLLEINDKIPNTPTFIGETTSFYNRIGEYQKAVDFIRSAIEKDKNNSNYYADMGYSYSLMRNFNEAVRAFLKSIELDKKNHLALNNLAWLYCENNVNIKEAIGYSIRSCELSPLNDAYLDTLAEAYYLDKQYDKAIETINKAIKINPNYTYLTQQLEKIKKAREEMEKNK